MNCRRAWNREILTQRLPTTFLNQTYKIHRENVLYERERSLLPDTQPKVAQVVLKRDMERERRNLYEQIQSHYAKLSELRKTLVETERTLRALSNNVNTRNNVFRNTVIRGCPKPDCRGFIQKDWTCGLCQTRICNKCHELLPTSAPASDDEPGTSASAANTATHECKPEDIETAEMIMKQTHPCPRCSIPIYKIDGCFAKNTPILLYDGTQKMSQDIFIGDVLFGDDATPRVVQYICTGFDHLYTIVPTYSTTLSPYTVNHHHKLVLHDIVLGEDHVMTVEAYLQIPPHKRRNLYGVRYNHLSALSSDGGIYYSYYPIHIVPTESHYYYGWGTDGNRRFLLPDRTVVHNCDQMFCTQCHTAFSWRTGEIVTRHIHNPHYYDWVRQNGDQAPIPREPGDIPCGGLPSLQQIRQWFAVSTATFNHYNMLAYRRRNPNGTVPPEIKVPEGFTKMLRIHQKITHIEHVETPRYRPAANIVDDNEDLRIQFLMNEINEDDLKFQLQKREKKKQKNQDIYMVYDMFNHTIAIICQNYISGEYSLENEQHLFDEMVRLRTYFNEQMLIISRRFNCCVPNISREWDVRSVHHRKDIFLAPPEKES
jgi:hypothetical protein